MFAGTLSGKGQGSSSWTWSEGKFSSSQNKKSRGGFAFSTAVSVASVPGKWSLSFHPGSVLASSCFSFLWWQPGSPGSDAGPQRVKASLTGYLQRRSRGSSGWTGLSSCSLRLLQASRGDQMDGALRLGSQGPRCTRSRVKPQLHQARLERRGELVSWELDQRSGPGCLHREDREVPCHSAVPSPPSRGWDLRLREVS